jgi:hypothetical protein
MKRTFHSRVRARLCLVGALVGTLSLARALAGCIIADTPEDLPKLPVFRPTILHGSVVPPDNQVLRSFPDKFVVPVELVDPTVTFQWRAFIDYDPVTGEGIWDKGTSSFDPASADGGVRTLEISLMAPADSSRCHVIEILVALGFRGEFEGRQAHTPDAVGGDSVSWFFAPSGDLQRCPTFDAGPDTDAADSGVSDGSGSQVQ